MVTYLDLTYYAVLGRPVRPGAEAVGDESVNRKK